MDYYQVLQISPLAEQEVVEAAYKRLALKYHPDTNSSPEAAERMTQINAAYKVLGDPQTRARYDRERQVVSSAVPGNVAVASTPTQIAKTQRDGATSKTYCVNHPQTETYLRCNKCGKPVCTKCVQRTPVGYRCRECLGEQRAGYYNATPVDYVLTSVIAVVLGGVAGFAMSLFNLGFFSIIIAIFVGPIAGGIISEAVRRGISKRRGRYIALTACVAAAIGSLAVLVGPVFLLAFSAGAVSQFFAVLPRLVVNIGFWVFLAVALSTTYARLRV